ncbi:MAG TPA: phosphatase PAP2 family protein [Thermoanaerobaculia bacterium]|jgi:undecaprenyl-diphosphatase
MRSVFLVGAVSAGVFVLTASAVAAGTARDVDERLRERFVRARSPRLDALSAVVTPLTSPALLIACSLATAVRFRRLGATVWAPIASAPFLAMIAGRCFTATMPRQYAPTSSDGKPEVSFPSGHTTGATAEALTISYILRRRRLLGRGPAMAMLLVPLIGGLNRLYRDRHWSSDIVAGLSAGSAIAAGLAITSQG